MVSGSPSVRPSATLTGSMSPIRSPTLVSGVASFSPYLSLACRQVTGRASPSSAASPRRPGGGVGGGELLAVPVAGMPPGDRQVIAQLGSEPPASRAGRMVGVVVDLA